MASFSQKVSKFHCPLILFGYLGLQLRSQQAPTRGKHRTPGAEPLRSSWSQCTKQSHGRARSTTGADGQTHELLLRARTYNQAEASLG